MQPPFPCWLERFSNNRDCSAGSTVGPVSDRWHQRCHSQTQTNPSDPGTMNAHCQPSDCMVQTVIGGVLMAPRRAPNTNIGRAVARSLAGNHCATALLAAGKFAASARPRTTSKCKKLQSPQPRACKIVARLQKMAARPKARWEPRRSIKVSEIS